MRKLIGKGTFTRAYQVASTGGNADVEIISTCPSKECYAMFAQDNPLAPVVERADYNDTFKMPLYPKVKAPKKQLNAEAYHLYRELKSPALMGLNLFQFIKQIEKNERIPEDTRQNIIDLAEAVCNGIDPQNMRFEISPRNISHKPNGDMVMLDCFFDVEKVWTKKGYARVCNNS